MTATKIPGVDFSNWPDKLVLLGQTLENVAISTTLRKEYVSQEMKWTDPRLRDLPTLFFSMAQLETVIEGGLSPIKNQLDKRDWIQALRSGEYTPSVGRLAAGMKNKIIGNCCLGVFCEMRNLEKVYSRDSDSNIDGWAYIHPSGAVMELLIEPFRNIIPAGTQEFLAHLNDAGWTFDQIATIIEVMF